MTHAEARRVLEPPPTAGLSFGGGRRRWTMIADRGRGPHGTGAARQSLRKEGFRSGKKPPVPGRGGGGSEPMTSRLSLPVLHVDGDIDRRLNRLVATNGEVGERPTHAEIAGECLSPPDVYGYVLWHAPGRERTAACSVRPVGCSQSATRVDCCGRRAWTMEDRRLLPERVARQRRQPSAI